MSQAGNSPGKSRLSNNVLHDASNIYRALVDGVRDYAIFALDPHGHIVTWNSGARHLKGYSADEIIGQHFSVFYPPEDVAADKPGRELEIAVAEGQVEDEGWRVRKDGSRFWANVLITALRNDTGELVGFAKVTRDLTERRAAQERLRASEEQFRLLVESVTDYAIFRLDVTGHVETWNAGAQRINGYSAAEIIGQHFSVFYPPEGIASGKPERELEIATRTGSYEEEGWRLRKDGSRFWASVVITPVLGANGRLSGFAKVTRDLTERLAAHERALEDARRIAREEAARAAADERSGELRALALQLQAQAMELDARKLEAEAANRAKSEFLAAMSHELRTPLNAIGGYAQLMQMGIGGLITGEQREHLDRIQRSQQHLMGLINDILNFSRIEAAEVAYDIGPVSLRESLDAVGPMIAPHARVKNLRLRMDTCSPAVVALADRGKVEQILLNLLSNAVKFTEDGDEIELQCGAEDDHVWLSVRDTGIGIPADQVEMIFAPFMQVGRRLANPVEGTGLGLAISRDLARAMGGDVRVESREGIGSTFTLTLPRAEPNGT